MSVSINGTNGLTFSDGTSQNTGATGFGFKNRIINGAMMIDQRNAGASVATSSGTSVFFTDRWAGLYSQTSKFTAQQNAGSVTPPVGFSKYLGITSSSAYTVGSSEQFNLYQGIEGLNTADLNWGTANAAAVTLSFWVRSSLTGTFGGCLNNTGKSRAYPFTYTISAANTWEQKTVTIAGDTTGTWATDNGVGIYVNFGLGVGSTVSATAGTWTGAGSIYGATGATSVVGTNGATFYITGVQLEKGSTATSFDYRPYGTELALCQRYYAKTYDVGTVAGTATKVGAISTVAVSANTLFGFQHPVNLRALPTVYIYSPGNGAANYILSSGTNVTAATNGDFNGTKNTMCYSTTCVSTDVYAHMVVSAEL
jgi:hypothetical protein